MTTNTVELDCLLSRYLVGTSVYPLGVFAADTVPYAEAQRLLLSGNTSKRLGDAHAGGRVFAVGFIVNSDKASKPGQHWVAFLLYRLARSTTQHDLRCEFFDSYGLSPFSSAYHTISQNLPAWITPSNTKYNTVCLQSLDSATCGHYCLMFLVSRARGISFDRFVNSFSQIRGGAAARDRLVEHSVANMRKLIPCIPSRCEGVANQCCVPQNCYRTA